MIKNKQGPRIVVELCNNVMKNNSQEMLSTDILCFYETIFSMQSSILLSVTTDNDIRLAYS